MNCILPRSACEADFGTLVRTFWRMDDSVQWLDLFAGVATQRQQWIGGGASAVIVKQAFVLHDGGWVRVASQW